MRGLILATAALVLAAPATPQAINPSVLRDLQSRLGSGVRGSVFDSSTQSSQPSSSGSNQSVGNSIGTEEEQELRRQQARQQLTSIYTPTEIEQDYRQRLGDSTLRQFGYDLFATSAPPSGVRSGAIGEDYVLGIGDELQISFRGAENSNETVFVDRDGRVVVGGLPPVRAAGRTLGQVRAELSAATRRTTLGTSVFVTVGEVRSASVFVGGEVQRPGQYNLSSVSGIATALAAAGGVRRSGSLRSVRLVRANGATLSVDLYGFLGIGTPASVRLQDGDRIVVPVIGRTVAVVGAVARPGIYELRGRESIASVVGFAGGALRGRGADVVLSRIEANGAESYQRVPTGTPALGGDAIQVVGASAGGAIGRVRLAGNVDNTGARPLSIARNIAELVGPADSLRPDTYMLAAVLKRRDEASGGQVFEVVNLAEELRGYQSTALRSNDELTIFSRNDIAFINSEAVRRIIVEGKKADEPEDERQGLTAMAVSQPPGKPVCSVLTSLEAIMKRSPRQRFNAFSRSAFFDVQKSKEQENASLLENTTDTARTNALQAGSLATRAAENPGTAVRSQQNGPGSLDTPESEPDRAERTAREEAQCPTVFRKDPELVMALLDSAISVGGSVRRSGAYPVGGTVTARDLSLVADGLLPGVQGLALDVTRAIGGTEHVEDGATALLATRLTAGDDIFFSALDSSFERQGVQLSGEVARPGYYTIEKGERLSDLLHRAGGLTPYAYPYGTVFTRESVKERQREGFARTARELNNSLLTVAARADKPSMDGLAGAAAMVDQLTKVKPSGRMVVEADPRVLAIRPDLDTVLEGGDTVFVPKRPNYVLALGDVNNPGALQFVNGKTPAQYLAEAGGTLSTADRKRAFLVLPDGTAQPIQIGGWSGGRGVPPPPGTTIIVPKNIDPLFRLTILRDVTAIIAQMATSAATVAVLATR